MYDTKDDIGAIKDRVRAKMLKDPRIAIRQLCMRDFYYFLRYFWPVVSSDPFQGNWHIELVCRELQELAERVGERLPALYDLLINVPPGSTKPFWEQTPVQMADGSWKLLKDVVVGDRVINRHGVGCDVTGVHIQGELPCVVIRTFGGRVLVCAEDHPILTADGWVNAGDIEVGQMLALMHTPVIEATSERSIDEFKLAGYFVGDGSVANNSCQLDGITPEYLDDFIECASNLGFDHYSRVQKNGVTTISLKSKKQEKRTGQFKGMGRGYRESTGPRKWLKDVGLAGKDSRTKEVPEFVFKGTDEQVAAFLSAYFHCDGCVSFKDSGKRSIVVSVTTVSKKLALGLQRLFLRLGISMRVRRRVAKNGFGYNRSLKNYIYFTVDTTDQDTAVRFLERIPISGPKERKLRKFKPQRRTFHQQYWPDRVSSIESSLEKKKCRCLSVSDGESFVAEGVVVHNTVSCSIMFPAWCWTRWFWMRFITVSYSAVLSLESAEFSRDLIRSAEFREIFPELEIKVDKDTKSNFRVQRVEKGRKILGGNRFSTSVGGTLTGFHGHILIVDDPLNPQQAASDNELRACNQWMSQTLPTRKTDKAVTPMLLIQQRLHQNDPTGYRLEHAPHSVRHICLPGEIKNYRAQVQPPELAANYSEDGLLDPVRLSWPVLNKLKEDLGQYGFSGQVGQFPVPPGGGMFQVDRFVLVDSVEHLLRDPNNILGVVRFWDKASTEDGGDWTVGVKMYQLARPDGGYWFLITDVRRGQWASHVRESIMRSVAEADGVNVPIFMEQEPGPIWEEEIVQMSDGHRKKLKDVVVGDSVINMDGEPTEVLAVFKQGLLPCLAIKTFSGRVVHAAGNHPFLTPTGWKNADKLNVGDVLALRAGNKTTPSMFPAVEECRLAGYFIGDGCCTWCRGSSFSCNSNITCSDTKQGVDIIRCAKTLNFDFRIGGSRGWSYYLSGKARDWLRSVGLAGKGTDTKCVPEWILSSDNVCVANFIGAFFACDGSAIPGSSHPTVEFYNTNLRLLQEIQSLLLRFGIYTMLRERCRRNSDHWKTRRRMFRLTMRRSDDSMGKFAERIPVYGIKKEKLKDFNRRAFDIPFISDPIVEIIPAGLLPCRCLEVASKNSFLVNDIVVHNSGGKDQADASIRNLAGFISHAERSTGDKVFRADPYSVQVNNGNVMLLQADWTHVFIEEHRFFPFSTYDDQVDAASGAFSKLAGAKVVQPW